MHIKIYFGDKTVFLCDSLNAQLQELLHHPDAVFIDEISNPAIKSLLHEIKKEDEYAILTTRNCDCNVISSIAIRKF